MASWNIVIIDELAHVNPPGSRHPQRFQDALELMEAGINVYTTLNIYETASHADLLVQGASAANRRIVPDDVIEQASIQLVDIPPSELVRRLRHGNIRLPKDFEPAISRFYEEANLMGLREMAARLFTERVAKRGAEPSPGLAGAWSGAGRASSVGRG